MTTSRHASRRNDEERREAKKSQDAYLARIKTEVSLEDVLRHMGIHLRRIGNSSFARCPYPDHQERTASFAADLRKNLWKCFGCARGGDALRLVRDLEAGGDWGETLQWFERHFNLLGPQGMQRQLRARAQLTEAAEASAPPAVDISKALAAPAELYDFYDRVYDALLDELPLDNYGAAEMRRRGVTRGWSERLGYRNLPISFNARVELAARFADRFDLANHPVPGFFRLKYQGEFRKWCFAGDGGGSRYLAMKLKEPDDDAATTSDLPPATLATAATDPETAADLVRHKYARDYRADHKIYIGGLLVPQRDRQGRIRALKIRNQNFTPELWLRARAHFAPAGASSLAGEELLKTLPADCQENYLAHRDAWVPKYIALASSEEKMGAGALLGIHWSVGAAARAAEDEAEFLDDRRAAAALLKPDYQTYRTPLARRTAPPAYPRAAVLPSDAVLWLTEGELKGDLIAYRLGVKVAALPGLAGHHFELFWEMNCYGDQSVLDARRLFDRIEAARLAWLELKFNKYKPILFPGNEADVKDSDMQKKLIFAALDDSDAAHLRERLSAAPPNASAFKSLVVALDEEDSLNVEKSAHRIAWHALHLNLPVVRCRWDGAVGKGLDDLLAAGGEWRLEGVYGKL